MGRPGRHPEPQLTIDNGTVEQSNNAFYGREGKWLIENHGADPDILVDNDPASVMAGRDPQLEKAIEVILDKIKKNPLTSPAAGLSEEIKSKLLLGNIEADNEGKKTGRKNHSAPFIMK